jgi:hypothetical protein
VTAADGTGDVECAFLQKQLKKIFDAQKGLQQGYQVVYFQTKSPILGKFSGALEWKMLEYFMVTWSVLRAIWFILLTYGIFDIFPHFGILCQEKSGNPGLQNNSVHC